MHQSHILPFIPSGIEGFFTQRHPRFYQGALLLKTEYQFLSLQYRGLLTSG